MCETSVFIIKDGNEEIVLETATRIVAENGTFKARNLFGEEKVFEGKFKEFDTSAGRFVVEAV